MLVLIKSLIFPSFTIYLNDRCDINWLGQFLLLHCDPSIFFQLKFYRRYFTITFFDLISKFFSTSRPSSTSIKGYFFLDVYTILNRIQLIIWTIWAFRILNPNHRSLAKQSNYKSSKYILKLPKQDESKNDVVINQQNYNSNQVEVDRRTWLPLSSGTRWSSNSDTHQVVEI